ncbi:MAG: cell division protein ZapB [Syntrophobacterales bacterium]|nr:MAG: cell division protein ZapB [Syntrophobacterales bacterium]
MDVDLGMFGELERRIRGIVEEYSTLKNRNQELENLLEEKNARLEEAESRARVLNEQEDAVRTKVDMLLDMLRDIEVS